MASAVLVAADSVEGTAVALTGPRLAQQHMVPKLDVPDVAAGRALTISLRGLRCLSALLAMRCISNVV